MTPKETVRKSVNEGEKFLTTITSKLVLQTKEDANYTCTLSKTPEISAVAAIRVFGMCNIELVYII